MRYSVIIPFDGELHLLERCVATIPDRDDIEVIIVDNNEMSVPIDSFKERKNMNIIFSDSKKGAGNARNVGISYAQGEWILFADSDDFYEKDAFVIFDQYKDLHAELIYFMVTSRFSDTLQPANRGICYNAMVEQYIESKCIYASIHAVSPWAKMIKATLIKENLLQFEDRLCANDLLFSLHMAYYAKQIVAVRQYVYCLTYRQGSITTIKKIEYLYDTFLARITANKFLKSKGLSKHQFNTLIILYIATKYGIKYPFIFLIISIKQRVNIFVGWRECLSLLRNKIRCKNR